VLPAGEVTRARTRVRWQAAFLMVEEGKFRRLLQLAHEEEEEEEEERAPKVARSHSLLLLPSSSREAIRGSAAGGHGGGSQAPVNCKLISSRVDDPSPQKRRPWS